MLLYEGGSQNDFNENRSKKYLQRLASLGDPFAAIIFAFTAIYPQMITPEMKTSLDQMLGSFSPELLGIFNIQLTGPSSLVSPSGFSGTTFNTYLLLRVFMGCFWLEQSDH